MMDGTQTIAWIEPRPDAMQEAHDQARRANMLQAVQDAKDRLMIMPVVGKLIAVDTSGYKRLTQDELDWLNKL